MSRENLELVRAALDELSKFNIAEQFETARTELEEFIEVGDQVITRP
jgi:hypothetical protein